MGKRACQIISKVFKRVVRALTTLDLFM
jgi:hypothetical protein